MKLVCCILHDYIVVNFLGTLDNTTMLLLVNAIHFKADWKFKFNKRNTEEEPFHVSKTETKLVQMMHIKGKFGFAKSSTLKSKILELEYDVSKSIYYQYRFIRRCAVAYSPTSPYLKTHCSLCVCSVSSCISVVVVTGISGVLRLF